ncbi:MAG TPA: hypothetical protein DDW51_28965 [Cyanobacteria bacterium UBA11367]|nr:hypothetical protein [Cyanobacteria bacterium UBA11367]
MNIRVRISGLELTNISDTPQPWWVQTDYLPRVINCFQKAHLWQGFRYCYNLLADQMHQFDSIEALLELSKFWESKGTYILSQSEASQDYTLHWLLNVRGADSPSANSLALSLNIKERYLQTVQNIEIEQLINFVSELYSTFADVMLFGPAVNIEVEGITYPRELPPRSLNYYFAPCLVNFFSRKFLAQFNEWDVEKKEKLLSLPMPPGCRRIEQRDLVILQWVDNLRDREHISQRLGLQDEWFVEAVNPPRDLNYNELGDKRATVPPLIPDNFVTFYSQMGDFGLEAVVPEENYQIEPETLARLQQWLEAGQLPDGKPLNFICLIVPSRTAAIRVRDQAKAAGMGSVYYVDNDGNLWLPYPYASLTESSEPQTAASVESSYWFNPGAPISSSSNTDIDDIDEEQRSAQWEGEKREFVEEIFAYFQADFQHEIESPEWLTDHEPINLTPPQDTQKSIYEILHAWREKEEWYEEWFYHIKIYPERKNFIFYSACTEGMPDIGEDQVLLMAEFLSRINWNIKFGYLVLRHVQEYGFDYWTIRYQTSIDCMGCQIDRALIRNIVRNNVRCMEKCVPLIRAIIKEDVSPAVAASWFKLHSQPAYCVMSDEEEVSERKLLQQLRDEGLLRQWDLRQVEELSGTILEMDYVGLEGQFKCQLQVRNKRREFICYALYPKAVPTPKLLAIAELFVLLDTDIGNFELDWDSGQLRYRTSIDFHGSQFNPVLAIRQAYVCADSMDRELPLLRLVIEEDVLPAEAIKQFYDDSDEDMESEDDEEFYEDSDDFEESESFDDD